MGVVSMCMYKDTCEYGCKAYVRKDTCSAFEETCKDVNARKPMYLMT